MHVPEVLPIHVGVDLRGGDIGVPQKLLNRSEVGATIEEMCRKRVAQSVRMCRCRASPIEDPPNIARSEPMTALIGEERSVESTRDGLVANLEPRRERVDRRLAERSSAFFGSLAPHPHELALKVDRVDVERAQFRHAKPRAVQDLENRIITATSPHRFGRVVVGFE